MSTERPSSHQSFSQTLSDLDLESSVDLLIDMTGFSFVGLDLDFAQACTSLMTPEVTEKIGRVVLIGCVLAAGPLSTP